MPLSMNDDHKHITNFVLLYRDIVDTEHCDGDAYKMLLGSLNDEQDNKTTPGAPVVSPPISAGSVSSPRLREFDFSSPRNSQNLTDSLAFTKDGHESQANDKSSSRDQIVFDSHHAIDMPMSETSISHSRQKSAETVPATVERR